MKLVIKRLIPIWLGLLAGVTAALAQESATGGSVSGAAHQGLGPLLAISFLGGLVSLATPCVFPMIPVTVSYFIHKPEHVIRNVVAYCLGIISTFAVVGVLVSTVFGAAGITRFATNPWVNVALGALFVVLALNLFGVYEFQLSFANKVNSEGRKFANSPIGPFLIGIAFTFTSFTCTGAIIAGLLALAAGKGSTAYAVLGMATYGFAFSLPFWALALFPSLIKKLPKSGDWLSSVKPTLGFIELAASVKFFSNADLVWQLGYLTRPVYLSIWGVIFAAMGVYLLRTLYRSIRPGHGSTQKRKVTPKFVIGFVLALVPLFGAGFFFTHKSGYNYQTLDAFIPPEPYPFKTAVVASSSTGQSGSEAFQAQELTFGDNYKKAQSDAKATGKFLFVDFTGVTCTNCRWMEKNVFPQPGVNDRLSKMVLVQLYTDRDTDQDRMNQELQQKLGKTIALPLYAVLDSSGHLVKTFEGAARNPGEFQQFLDDATAGKLALNEPASHN